MFKELFNDEKAEAPGNVASTIIRVAAILVIGVVILSGVVGSTSMDQGTAATNTLTFSANPSTDGATFTIGSDTYEFDTAADGVVSGNIEVTVGATLADTLDAIVTASESSGTEAVTLTEDGTDTVTVTADETGTDANDTATTTDESTATWDSATLTGGVDGDAFYNLMETVKNNVSSGYTLAGLIVLALGASAVMRFLGFMWFGS